MGIRTVLALAVCIVLGFVGAKFLYPTVAASYLDQQTEAYAKSISAKPAAGAKATPQAAITTPAGSAWVYITDKQGNPTAGTKSAAPAGLKIENSSRDIELNGEVFHESVFTNDKTAVHVGWPVAPSFESIQQVTTHLPAGFVFAWFALSLLLFLPVPTVLVVGPMRKLEKASEEVLGLDVEARAAALDSSGLPFELKIPFAALQRACAIYDREKFERLTREHELKKQKKALTEEKLKLEQTMHDHLYQSHRSISELSFKESEEALLKLLDTELGSATTVSQVAQRALDRLTGKYPTSVRQLAIFYANPRGRLELDYYLGFSDGGIQTLKSGILDDITHAAFNRGTAIALTGAEQAQFKLDEVCRTHGWSSFYLAPLMHGGRQLGCLVVCFDEATKNTLQDRRPVLQNVAELVSRTAHKLVILNEELMAARTDALTGLYNKKFFEDTIPKLLDRARALGHQVSVLMVDGDHFKEINDTYGHQAGDQMLQELARLMKLSVRSEEQEKAGRFKDYVIRWGGEEFLIVLDSCGKDTAARVAERLRKTVAEKKDWPAGIAKWTISIGLSTAPEDAESVTDLTKCADVALYYCKKELGRNKVCRFEAVPKAFRVQMGGAMQGELGVFDPVAILQSLATAQKTGVFTVSTLKGGRHFWMQWHQGKPVQARLGSLCGSSAIVEFITTFEDGKFNFQEKPDAAFKKMLDDAYDVTRSLERCLMDAALAQDNLAWAKTILQDASASLHLVTGDALTKARAEMERDKDSVTPEDITIVSTICDALEYGDITMAELCTNLEHLPSAIIWRGVALMIKFCLIQTKSLSTASI